MFSTQHHNIPHSGLSTRSDVVALIRFKICLELFGQPQRIKQNNTPINDLWHNTRFSIWDNHLLVCVLWVREQTLHLHFCCNAIRLKHALSPICKEDTTAFNSEHYAKCFNCLFCHVARRAGNIT